MFNQQDAAVSVCVRMCQGHSSNIVCRSLQDKQGFVCFLRGRWGLAALRAHRSRNGGYGKSPSYPP